MHTFSQVVDMSSLTIEFIDENDERRAWRAIAVRISIAVML
jgi:hypothetical protein